MQQVLQGKVEQVMKFSGLAVFSVAVFVFGLAFASPAKAEVAVSTPVSVGNYDSWTLDVGSSKTSAVTSNDEDTSYISRSHNNGVQTFTMSGAGIPAGSTVNSVSLHVVARVEDGNPQIKLILENGVTSSTVSNSALTLMDDYITNSIPLNVNPFTSAAWTASEVNNWTTKFGVRKINSSGTALVTQIYVLVSYTPDTTAPVVTEVTPITTPTNNTTPTYVFHSTEAGTIFYGGDCASEIAPGGVGNHTVTFGTLAPGVYSNCTIQIADASANTSTVLNISSFTIDTTAPVINAHDSVTAEATGPTGATVAYTVPTATDNVDASVVVTCAPASGSLFVLGSTAVTCNATDAAGNIATPVGFSVVVQDTTAPVIDSPTHTQVEATGPDGSVATYTVPNATDVVDGTFPATCSPLSGTLFALGMNEVSCTATDSSDNTVALPTIVNVNVRDITPPVITLIGDAIILLNTGDAYVEQGATASDIVDGDVTAGIVVDSSAVNNMLPGGYAVTYSSTDLHSNNSTITRTVFVSDHSAPVINPIPDMTVEATSALNTLVDYGTITATDDVDGTFDINPASCLPLSGSAFAIGTTLVHCNATDAATNVGFGLALSVTVQDTTAPSLVITPDTQTVEATSTLGAEAFFTVDATDAVDTGVDFSIECSAVSGSMFPIGTTIVTCTAHDETGNYTTSTASIIIVDTGAPLPFAVADQTFEATGPLTSPTLALPAISDSIDPAPILTYTPSSSFPLGTTVVTWTATDFSGNTRVVTSNVIIIDTTAPVITLHGDSTVTLTVGDSYTEQGASVTDNHDTEMPAPTVGGDVVNTSVAGTYHVTYDAHDGSGNNAVQQVRTVVVNAVPSSGGGSGGSGTTYVPPTPPSFGGQPITVGGGLGNTSTVQLTFDVQNASWMAISETPDFTNVSWVPYTTNTTFTLSASNTESKLYIKFRRVNGGETKVQEVNVLPNSPSTLIQAVLGVRITRLGELLAKLKLGSRGPEVVELQGLLKEAGFFPAAQAATGYYGPITLAAANKAMAASKAVLGVKIVRVDELVAKLKVGDKGEEVAELQTLLKQAGFFPAAQAVTGYYGPITNASVKKYLASVK